MQWVHIYHHLFDSKRRSPSYSLRHQKVTWCYMYLYMYIYIVIHFIPIIHFIHVIGIISIIHTRPTGAMTEAQIGTNLATEKPYDAGYRRTHMYACSTFEKKSEEKG